jgi:hypothetical protein
VVRPAGWWQACGGLEAVVSPPAGIDPRHPVRREKNGHHEEHEVLKKITRTFFLRALRVVVKNGLRLAALRLRENLAAGECRSKNKTFQESSANRFFLRALGVNKFRNEALVQTFLNADLIRSDLWTLTPSSCESRARKLGKSMV